MGKPRQAKIPPAKISLGNSLKPTRKVQVLAAQKLLAQFLPRSVIKARLIEQFQVGKGCVEQILAQAYAIWVEEAQRDSEALRQEFIEGYRLFYNQAMSKEAFAPARQAIRDMGILQGINPEVNAHARLADAVGNVGQSIADVDPERVRARIADLAVRHAAANADKGEKP